MESSQRLQELFDRYLERGCEPHEVAELVVLLEQADAAEVLTEPMRRLWEELKDSETEYPVDWEKMYTRIRQVDDDLSVLRPRKPAWLEAVWILAAACFVLVVAGFVFWRMDQRHRVNEGTVLHQQAQALLASRTLKTSISENARRVVHLPDGSMVMLNKNSTLEYSKGVLDSVREVKLIGEAFFDIVHLPGQPFLVHTGKLTTRVLGTAFNIRAYPGDKAIAITVTSGRVQVLNERKAVGLLAANQQMRYELGSEAIVRQKVDVRPLVAWRPSEVSFDDITMEEAARRVGNWFGVKVSFLNPALKDCRVTASFYREDELEEIMTVLCGVNQMSYTIHGGEVLVDGRGCN